jgi:two-component system LytT family sensor kinase
MPRSRSARRGKGTWRGEGAERVRGEDSIRCIIPQQVDTRKRHEDYRHRGRRDWTRREVGAARFGVVHCTHGVLGCTTHPLTRRDLQIALMTDPRAIGRRAWWALGALLAGAVVGVLDLAATEVQGPALLLMTAAFCLAAPRKAPAWLVGVLVGAGIPAAHIVAGIFGARGDASFGMLVALAPALLAAYAGRVFGALVASAGNALPRGAETAEAAARRWYDRPMDSRVLLGTALVGCAIAGGVPVYATLVAREQPFAWWLTLVWQLVSLVGWVVLTPLVLRLRAGLARRELGAADAPMTAAEAGAHAAVVTGIAVGHAAGVVILTRLLFIQIGPAGFGPAIAWAFAAYLVLDALTYVLVLSLAYASDTDRHLRDAAQRAAALSSELNQSRLAALVAQLRPHFMFNALNAAAVLARRGDAAGAVHVLTGLAELLRYVLQEARQTVKLGEELEFVGRYLEIERVRFSDRLRVSMSAEGDASDALVPPLLLQPLVENAVRHGIAKRIEGGEIRVRAWHDAGVLHVTVEDDGAGIAAGPPPVREEGAGLGLANTRARLALLYRGAGSLTLGERPEGGAIAELSLPFISVAGE